MPYDIIIINGKIVDGTGGNAYTADIAVQDGYIVGIGDFKSSDAFQVIEAKGKFVTPGFIDMHSHGDETLLIYPRMESKVRQGITTIVAGQCGLSPAPMDKYWLAVLYEHDILQEINTNVFLPEFIIELDRIKDRLHEEYGLDVDWKTFGEFLRKVEEQGISINYVPLVGHGQVRTQVMGKDYQRAATADEMAKMKEYIAEAMRSGAYGVSVGLDYVPGIYADFNELLEIAKTAAGYQGIYSAHWRRTGLRVGTPKRQKKIDGIIETLEIGRQADIQVQIAHLMVGYDIFPANDDFLMMAAAQRTLQVIDRYLKMGVRAAFDVIPDVAGMLIKPDLISLFHPWVKLAGSIEQFIRNIKAHDYRQSIIDTIMSGKHYDLNPQLFPDWDEFITVIGCKNKDYIGPKIAKLAEQKAASSVEVLLDILGEDPYTKVYMQNIHMNKCAVQEFLKHPQATVCTDSFALDLKSTWKEGKSVYSPGAVTYCGFIEYLTEFKMERIEDTIRKATGKPAEILGFKDRGFIKEGQKADLLVIDLENLKTNENYLNPRVYPDGIEYVLVNGQAVFREGSHTGCRPGEIIRKSYD